MLSVSSIIGLPNSAIEACYQAQKCPHIVVEFGDISVNRILDIECLCFILENSSRSLLIDWQTLEARFGTYMHHWSFFSLPINDCLYPFPYKA